MYLEVLKSLLAKMTEVVEDLWIEKECYKDILLSASARSQAQLDELTKTVLSNPELRKQAREHFRETWKKLDEVGKRAAYELHLLEPPPTDKPN